ncbi:MAG TPA: type II toxin-antitoxin system VapC family toxin [Geminicoccaceae bacterium]|nr:type II toxin-antitoxin system VapC family toxin [Geminicoccaceae bacterium]
MRLVVDTSAIVAALAEADYTRYLLPLQNAAQVSMSAVNVYESRLILTGRRDGRPRFDPALIGKFEQLLTILSVQIVPFDAEQAMLAHAAYLRWGKGFHPAALNMADCAAYALSRLRREPLLFKGENFAATDVELALDTS